MNKLDERISLLTRNLERYQTIVDLRESIRTCNEDAQTCDVCVGLNFAINIIKRRIEE